MSFSQGSVILQQKRSAGPVTAGARNGTNIVSGYVELGGGTSYPFLHNTLVDTNIYNFKLGDLDFVQNGSLFFMDDPNKQISFNLSSGTRFLIDTAANVYKIGDITGTLNSSKIVIDDSNAAKSITYTAPTNHIWQVGAAGATEAMRINSSGFIGIGDNNPQNNLVVSGSAAAGQIGISINNTSASGYSVFRIGTAIASPVGMGLHQFNSGWIGSGAYAANTSTLTGFESGGLILHAENASGTIKFFTAGNAAGNERARITAAGKFGVLTTTPTMFFEVAGSMGAQQGADVASANNLTLGSDGNSFEITGTTQINLIANTGRVNGAIVNLIFTSNPTVKNGQATSGSNITILLAGAADFVASSNDVLTLMLCEVGGTQAWREVCRSVN